MDTEGDLATIFQQETFDQQTFGRIRMLVYGSSQARDQFVRCVADLVAKLGSPSGADSDGALKVGMSYCLLGRHTEALSWLAAARDARERRYYSAVSLRALGRYAEAATEFERAAHKGAEPMECQLQEVDCHIHAGNLAKAEKILAPLASQGAAHAGWHYEYGCLLERQGQIVDAIAEFERAISIDETHAPAMFRLAYALDLRGEDEKAIELYQRCVARPPVHLNALMNLAVIYEDRERFDDALACLKQVLSSNPNHARARMFLKDVEASMEMIIDEDQERVRERRSAVLDIPVTDFELSVRARNCLKKMNIANLGDLLRITEADLLAYKNFGETSLNEIKAMLAQKGLRLGQSLEEQRQARRAELPPLPANVSPDILNKSVSELDLSVRSRKCLQRLNISTMGDLAMRTEAELLGMRNFGQTSLNEIKERLAEHGITLRKLET
jgi:DNA-directed RNA polymerase subunit alpha